MSQMKRKAYWAKKKAWFQGQKEKSMEGAITSNDPEKLGYPNKEIGYEKGPMAVTAPGGEDSRPWEQKWFEGAAAVTKTFMGPAGEEFKEKQHWLRIPADEKIINANTKLTAKFSAVAKDPKGSYWTFFVDGKPVIASTLGKIWGDTLDEKTAKETATKAYAKTVMTKMRTEGLPKVAYLLTGVKLEKTAETKDGKKTAWYKEEMDVEDALDHEAETTGNELGVAENVAEQKLEEIESLEEQIVEKIAPEGQAVEVFKGLQEAEEALEQTASELKSIRVKLASGNLSAANKIQVIKLAEGAIADAVTTFEASDDAMQDGHDLIPDGGEEDMEEEPMQDGMEVSEEEAVKMADEAIQAAESFVAEGGEEMPAAEGMNEMPGEAIETKEEVAGEPVAEQTTTISKEKVRKFVEGRKAKRNAIAEMKEEKKYEVIPEGGPKDGHAEIERAHPDGTHFVSDLTAGGTPKEKLDGFVTGIEAQENDVAIAEKTPKGNYTGAAKTKVTTAATEHPVTPDTKSYWVDYFSLMGPEGKKFGQALVADHTDKSGEEIGKAAKTVIDKQVNSALEIQKGKLRRANELAELAATKGMVAPTVDAKLELVDSIMGFDDGAFASYKKAVDSAPARKIVASEELGIKTASVKALKVGQIQEQATVSVSEGTDEYSALSGLGWK